MKIRRKRFNDAGARGPRTEVTVVEITEGDPMPPDSEAVSEDTPLHDWQVQAEETKSE